MSVQSPPGNLRAIILGSLTIGLLVLYAVLVIDLICDALGATNTLGDHVPTQRVSYLITTIQSLVSALVIAVLAISPPKGPVRVSFLALEDEAGASNKFTQGVAALYVAVWFLTGAAALVVGYIVLSDELAMKFKTLVDFGSAWLGLAIAAAYAFLGIKPPA